MFPEPEVAVIVAVPSATEVIEHFPKDKGALLLSELERVARQCIIISTPVTRELRGGLDGLYGYRHPIIQEVESIIQTDHHQRIKQKL